MRLERTGRAASDQILQDAPWTIGVRRMRPAALRGSRIVSKTSHSTMTIRKRAAVVANPFMRGFSGSETARASRFGVCCALPFGGFRSRPRPDRKENRMWLVPSSSRLPHRARGMIVAALGLSVAVLPVIGCAGAGAKGGGEAPVVKLDFEKYTLPNGLDVILRKDSRL